MRLVSRVRRSAVFVVAAALLLIAWTGTAFAQTDEIQVYDAQIADPGVLNLELHNNYTPDGLKISRFPGGLSQITRSTECPNGLMA